MRIDKYVSTIALLTSLLGVTVSCGPSDPRDDGRVVFTDISDGDDDDNEPTFSLSECYDACEHATKNCSLYGDSAFEQSTAHSDCNNHCGDALVDDTSMYDRCREGYCADFVSCMRWDCVVDEDCRDNLTCVGLKCP